MTNDWWRGPRRAWHKTRSAEVSVLVLAAALARRARRNAKRARDAGRCAAGMGRPLVSLLDVARTIQWKLANRVALSDSERAAMPATHAMRRGLKLPKGWMPDARG